MRNLCASAAVGLLMLTPPAYASESPVHLLDFTQQWTGLLSLALFAIAYLLVTGEEPLSLKKSKPMLVAAGLIWVLVAISYTGMGDIHTAETLFRDNIEHYTELFLFLLAAMTYVNALNERGVFLAFRQTLINRGLSLRQIFWITGIFTFVISPFMANLAVALLMATIIMTVAANNHRFIIAGSINIVVAANAGGVFSPFGDVTTLMVWQRGLVDFQEFFVLWIPALASWLIPAVVLSYSVDNSQPQIPEAKPELREGAWFIICLFVFTLFSSVFVENFLHIPAAIGMMTGLGFLKLYGYQLKRQGISYTSVDAHGKEHQFDIFRSLERSEWDTLMFLLGIVLAVGGLSAMGYLLLTSEFLYGHMGPTAANILIGMLSSFVENVPVMYSVLAMDPVMNESQWLLITLTAGLGGSLLSIGSAAGVAVMGQARGVYTFMAHLRWTWLIAVGYVVSIWLHLSLNSAAV